MTVSSAAQTFSPTPSSLVVFFAVERESDLDIPTLCTTATSRFSGFDEPTISTNGPITTLSFGKDGAIEVIDVEQSLPTHLHAPTAVADTGRHIILLAKAGGDKVMDRVVSAVYLMALGWSAVEKGLCDSLYWAPSGQWVIAEQWQGFAEPACDDFILPKRLWVKVHDKSGNVLETYGLGPFVGFELIHDAPQISQQAVHFVSKVSDYVLDPNTPVPSAGQTFGGSAVAEFQFQESQDQNRLRIVAL